MTCGPWLMAGPLPLDLLRALGARVDRDVPESVEDLHRQRGHLEDEAVGLVAQRVEHGDRRDRHDKAAGGRPERLANRRGERRGVASAARGQRLEGQDHALHRTEQAERGAQVAADRHPVEALHHLLLFEIRGRVHRLLDDVEALLDVLERGGQDVGHGARRVLARLHRRHDVALAHRLLHLVDQLGRHQLLRLDHDQAVDREVDREHAVAEEREPEQHADRARPEDDIVEAAALLGRVGLGVGVDDLAVRAFQFLSERAQRRDGGRAGSDNDHESHQRFLELITSCRFYNHNHS